MLGVHHSTISRAVKKGVLLPAFTTPGRIEALPLHRCAALEKRR